MRLAIVLLLAACSESTDPQMPAEILRVEISRTGGFAPTPAAGSTCTPMDDRYTLTIATQILTWQLCASSTPDGVYVFQPGQARLSDGAFVMLSNTLYQLQPVPSACGGDISDRIVFTTTAGETTIDSAQCDPNEPFVFEQLLSDAR